jgi:hypothetical protein
MAQKKKLEYPTWVCDPCGTRYGQWYQPGTIGPKVHYATYHMGTCDVCKSTQVPVTEPRDYGHLIESWAQATRTLIAEPVR